MICRIGRKPVRWLACVVKNAPQQVLLGDDFQEARVSTISYKKGILTMLNGSKAAMFTTASEAVKEIEAIVGAVTTERDVKWADVELVEPPVQIFPGETVHVPGWIPKEHRSYYNDTTVALVQQREISPHLLAVQAAICDVSRDTRRARVALKNIAPTFLELDSGDQIARARLLRVTDISPTGMLSLHGHLVHGHLHKKNRW